MTLRGSILVADDDAAIRTVLSQALSRAGHEVRATSSATTLLRWAAAGDGDLIVTDVVMPDGNAFDLLPRIKKSRPDLPVVVMSAQNTFMTAIRASEAGAYEYLPKPFDLTELIGIVNRALAEPRRGSGGVFAREEAAEQMPLVGRSAAMQDIYRLLARLMQTDLTVMIAGESGTGKELVARALHEYGRRRAGPFVAINMAAIPRDLIESELFGHEKGAFTGAQSRSTGRFEQAEGGTLFLDEIGDMPFDLQTRLLRVLSDGQFYRVGGHAAVKAHVRVIAATHQNLEQRVKDGAFREDLFHRLNVIRLRLPALRERSEDVPMLTRHFLQQSARQLGVEPKRISEGALALLTRFGFPGNVRQLENICHWLTVMAPAQVISPQDLPPEVLDASSGSASLPVAAPAQPAVPVEAPPFAPVPVVAPAAPAPVQALPLAGWEPALESEAQKLLHDGLPDVWGELSRRFESQLIRTALHLTHGRRMEAAQRLGIGRNTITRKIQELGLDAPDEG
jgi:two-component system nitrogen regulation response regulator GlnG